MGATFDPWSVTSPVLILGINLYCQLRLNEKTAQK